MDSEHAAKPDDPALHPPVKPAASPNATLASRTPPGGNALAALGAAPIVSDVAAERQADAFAERVATQGAPAPIAGARSPGTGAASGGAPLDAADRVFFESSFGQDFSGVRVHRDDDAAAAARGLGASAYTVGENVVFGRGQYEPGTSTGRKLLAHELVHVVQQRAASDGPVVQRKCDPAIQSCMPDPDVPAQLFDMTAQACLTPDAIEGVAPVEEYSCPATFDLELDVEPPASLEGRLGEVERIRLANPILWWRREDVYAVPIELVFDTPEAATTTCQAPPPPEPAPPASFGPDAGTPGEPQAGPLATLTPDRPFAPPFAIYTGPPYKPPAPQRALPSRYAPGQIVYTLDGPLPIVSANDRYVFTRVWTKLAVGAGSLGIAYTSAGYVIVDAGMKQVGGRIDEGLADALLDVVDSIIGADTPVDFVGTHMHLDHTMLFPRLYGRHPVRSLSLNAVQAFVRAKSGTGTELERIVRLAVVQRQIEVAKKVRAELSSQFGPWSLYVDDAERDRALEAEVQRVTQQRVQAMPLTSVRIAIPQGGTVVHADVPIGNIALPSELAPDTSPITRPLTGENMATVLNPEAGAATQQVLAGQRISNNEVDAQATSLLVKMPSNAMLLVISDVRAEDSVALTQQFAAAISQLSGGKEVPFLVLDATHHLQRGFTQGDAIARASQLAAWTRMLYEFQKQAGGGNKLAGGALVVSVNGEPGQSSYVDPALVWVLKDLGWSVMPATGGGVRGTGANILGSAQDIHVIEVAVGEQTLSGIVGPSWPGLEPTEYLTQRANAALSQLDAELVTLTRRQAVVKTEAERQTLAQQIRDKTQQRVRLDTRFKAYLADVNAQIGRSPTDTSRPSVAPAANQPPPAIAAAAALREELAPFSELVVGGDKPRLADEALVVLGQPEHARLSQEARNLLAAYERVASLKTNLRWSTPVEQRQPLIDALEAYRVLLLAAAGRAQHSQVKDYLLREAGKVDADLTSLTGRSAADLEAIRHAAALAAQASKNVAQPAEVKSLTELADGPKANEIITTNNGLVLAAGRLYQLTSAGNNGFTLSMVRVGAAFTPRATESRPPPMAPALVGQGPQAPPPAVQDPVTALTKPEPIVVPGPVPAGFAQMPNIINISGRTIEISATGQSIPPTPSEPLSAAKPGDLIVRGFNAGYFVTDPMTGRPIAGAMLGGEWWQVQKNGTLTLVVDAAGNVQQVGAAYRFVTESLEKAEYGGPVGSAEARQPRFSRTTRVAAAGMSIIAVANDIMAPINATLGVQRHYIAQGKGQIAFWSQFGGDPQFDMRTQHSNESRTASSAETAAVYGEAIIPTVTGINKQSLKDTLEKFIRTHADLMTWLFLGRIVEAIEISPDLDVPTAKRDKPRTYSAIVAPQAGVRGKWPRIDITDIIEPIEKRTAGALETSMQSRVSALSSDERANVFELKSGSETRILRNKVTGFWHKGVSERVRSSSAMFGPHPWVHVVKREGGYALVEAANADAARATVAAAYEIRKSLGDVYKEVKEGGRPITQEWRDDGSLVGFVAGPSPTDPRFQGETRYYKSAVPDFISLFGEGPRPDWTAAFGQLDQFWVDADELVPLDGGTLDKYAPAKKP